MFQRKQIRITLLLIAASIGLTTVSCDSDDDADSNTMVEVSVNGSVLFDDGDDFMGDVDGDFTGNGGSGSRVFVWQNALTRADYNADITTATGGSFRIVVQDAESDIVLDSSLNGDSEPDSIDGVTESGVPGVWTVTITLTSFDGDGSFSLSEGD